MRASRRRMAGSGSPPYWNMRQAAPDSPRVVVLTDLDIQGIVATA
jgi:hypothetical protein